MNAGRDFLLFVLFLIALGVAWFLTGGPNRAISHEGWFLNAPGTTEGIGIPSVGLSNEVSNNSNGSSGGAQQTSSPTNLWDYFLNYQPGVGETSSVANSPYAPYVSLQASDPGAPNPADEYITIETSQNLPQDLVVSDWTLENVLTNQSVTIGNAADIPFLGDVNSETPISVGPGSEIIVTTGASPNGTSFRLNECTGYFNQFQSFFPQLPEECPTPTDEMLLHASTLSGDAECQAYVRTLSQCTLIVGSFPPTLSSACQNLLFNDLSYNGCITEHRSDPNFYQNVWRVFLNRDQDLWNSQNGNIRLLDENGKTIAQVTY